MLMLHQDGVNRSHFSNLNIASPNFVNPQVNGFDSTIIENNT